MSKTFIPLGECQCGCGKATTPCTHTKTSEGKKKGMPNKFIMGHQRKGKRDNNGGPNWKGESNPRWNGGKTIDRLGYVWIYRPEHQTANKSGFILEHRFISEASIGKPLPSRAEIHHVDEDPGNNSNDNLVICQDHAYHLLLHKRSRSIKATGHPNYKLCPMCKAWIDIQSFYKTGPYCKECSRIRMNDWMKGNQDRVSIYNKRYSAKQRGNKNG